MSQQAPRNEKFFRTVCAIAFLNAAASWALEPSTHQNSGIPCAVLENFGGDVEVLDPSRTRVAGLSKSAEIPCGGWISTGNGWAIIHHRDGHDPRVGANSFLEVPESHPDTRNAKDAAFADQVVLYRGEMFGSTEGGAGELRVITANSRVRVKHGTALINFSPDEQDTQLIALDGPASLENRFEPSKRVQVKAGESTNLNFKLLRVIPTYPKAVSVAMLKGKLGSFRITDEDKTKMYETAQARAERRLAADLQSQEQTASTTVEHEDEKVVSNRKIASVKTYHYNRAPVSPEEAATLKAQWVKKMTGGEAMGEKILYPDRFYGKPRKVKIVVADPAEKLNQQKQKSDDEEKKRLIEELSRIHED